MIKNQVHSPTEVNSTSIAEIDPSLIVLSLTRQIHTIAEEIIENESATSGPGLLGGQPGIALFFAYLSKVFPEKDYTTYLFQCLDQLGDMLSNQEMHYNISGVAGTAFVFQHLRNIGILDLEDDLNLAEIDKFIEQGIEVDRSSNNWDPLHGMVGLGVYFLERNKENSEVKFLEKIVDHLSVMRVDVEGHKLWITPGYKKISNDNYNFGMAHGMPGILSFLAQVYARGIRQESISNMIESCLPFLLKHEMVNDSIYCFPSGVDVNPSDESPRTDSRLGWCYGDLCIANTLIHCGKALKNETWFNKGIEIAIKTTRRTFENAACMDAPFCHGTTGLLHQYQRLYRLTNEKIFKETADKWLQFTLDHFFKPGTGAGGYHFRTYLEDDRTYEMVPNYSLLEGSAGIALVYLSYLYDIKPEWDQIFFTNV